MPLSHGLQITLCVMDLEYYLGVRWTPDSIKSIARLLFPGWIEANWSSSRALEGLRDRGLVVWDDDWSRWYLTDAGREAVKGLDFAIGTTTNKEHPTRGGIYGVLKGDGEQ